MPNTLFRFPEGANLEGLSVGGRFASAAQVRAGNVGTVSVQSRIPQIIAGMQIRANAASAETAEAVMEDARRRLLAFRSEMPNWTGELYDSYYIFHGSLTDDYLVATDVEHGPLVEFGSIHNDPPRPHLVPAIEENRVSGAARVAASMRGL